MDRQHPPLPSSPSLFKFFSLAGLLLALVLLFAAIRFLSPPFFPLNSTKSKKQLRIFTWAAFFHPDFVKAFEEKYHCHLLFDYFDSNETLQAKLLSGATRYDLVTPSSYMVDALAKEGLISPLNLCKIPLYHDLDVRYTKKLSQDHLALALPISVSYSGIGYLTTKHRPERSWSAFLDPSIKGRMTLLNDYRETLGAALLALGKNPNTKEKEEIEEAKRLVKLWREQSAIFDSESYKMGMSSGEFLLCHAYSGDIYQVRENRSDVGFFCPVEGAIVSIEEICLLEQSEEKALAHAFISALMEPQNALLNMQKHHMLAPYTSIYKEVEAQEIALTLSQEEIEKSVLIEHLGEASILYQEAWKEIRFAP